MNSEALKATAGRVLSGPLRFEKDAEELATFALQIADVLDESGSDEIRTVYVGQKGFALVDRQQYDSMRVRIAELDDKINRQRRIIDNLTTVRKK